MPNEQISLREHFDARCDYLYELFEARWRAHEQVHEMGQRAVDAAFEAAQTKLHELNEVRQQSMEDRADFLRRDVYEGDYRVLQVKVEAQGKWIDNMSGRLWALGVLLLIINVGIGLLLRFWPK